MEIAHNEIMRFTGWDNYKLPLNAGAGAKNSWRISFPISEGKHFEFCAGPEIPQFLHIDDILVGSKDVWWYGGR